MLKHSKVTLEAADSNDPAEVDKLAKVVIDEKRMKAKHDEREEEFEVEKMKSKAIAAMKALDASSNGK